MPEFNDRRSRATKPVANPTGAEEGMGHPAGKPTGRIINPDGKGAKAWCPQCKGWRPAGQVGWNEMSRNKAGDIKHTYALKPH